ncbi:putative ribonuclease H-like domain-containing protein [Tanacetum coccineum]
MTHRHMTGNMSYLSDFKEFDGGYVTFGGGAKGGKIIGKGTLKTCKLDFEDVYFIKELYFNLFSVSHMCDKKNSVLFTDTGCFVLSPDFKLTDESQVLLKVPRKNNMYSVDIKNIVPKQSLTCLVAKATLDESMLWHRRLGHGKQCKAYCKSKIQNSITQPLFMLHMDLFGPTFMSSIMNKKYCLVVTDDYSRFTWVFFLASKDETSGIIKSFITEIENLVDKKVKIIRCDNGTEFKNRVMGEFCEKNDIKKEFSAARTPQQNGVAERRNRTLIEDARTMVLVVKPHNKTPYELFRGRTPALSFMRPFGCHVTILNTLDYLGKFDGKSDEGFFVGYSLNSKAFRVYNIRTRKVEESLHIRFLEDKPIIAGDGLKWLFDIDKESIGAGHSSKETRSSQDYILMPLWKDGVNKESGIDDQERPKNSSQDVNTTGLSINTASTHVNTCSLHINIVSPTITTTSLEATHVDFFGDETEIDMSNITTTYLIDVKTAFLYDMIEEEVYVCQPLGFEDPEFPDRVNKVEKIRSYARKVEVNQDKYVDEILKKFGFSTVKTASTPMETSKPLMKDENAKDVDVHLYRSMIGSLMYLTSSRPDIMFVVCACARFQVTPKVSHLHVVKRIFRYLKGEYAQMMLEMEWNSS